MRNLNCILNYIVNLNYIKRSEVETECNDAFYVFIFIKE